MKLLPSGWCISDEFFTPWILLSTYAIAAVGATLAPAISAPRARLLVGLSFALLVSIAGPVLWDGFAKQIPAIPVYAKAVPLAFPVGAMLAVGSLYAMQHHKRHSSQALVTQADTNLAASVGLRVLSRLRQVVRWTVLVLSGGACLFIPISPALLLPGVITWIRANFSPAWQTWFLLYVFAAHCLILFHLWISRTSIVFKVNWTTLVLTQNAIALPVYWVRVLLLGRVEGTEKAL